MSCKEVYCKRTELHSPRIKANALARGLCLCTYMPKISFSIPAKHFGTRFTTTFIQISLLYHLQRQRYPKIVSISISITARTYSGHRSPSRMPRQKASMLSPTAFDAPRIQKFIILKTSVSVVFVSCHIICIRMPECYRTQQILVTIKLSNDYCCFVQYAQKHQQIPLKINNMQTDEKMI